MSEIHVVSWVAAPIASAAALMLAAGGWSKVLRPSSAVNGLATIGLRIGVVPARALGIVEIAVGLWVVVAPGTLPNAFGAGLYVMFAVYLAIRLRRGITGGCGCGGIADVPPSWLHASLDVVAAFALTVGAMSGLPSPADVAASTPLAGVPYAVGTVAIAFVAFHAVTLLPPLFSVTTKGLDTEWLDAVIGDGARGRVA